jgi:MFS transporter, ACS family, tartrate transporter
MRDVDDEAMRASTAETPLTSRLHDIKAATKRIIDIRICSWLFLGNFLYSLDRTNVSYAALQMNVKLGFTAQVFGFGVSCFYLGFVLFDVPSNLILRRVGASLWMSRILITWGVIAAANAFVYDDVSFYIVRFLLGAMEAGFVPGTIYVMSYWYTAEQRGRASAIWFVSLVVSGIISGPVSTSLMQLQGFGLDGWQWMFLLEGVFTSLIGVLYWIFVPERPEDAAWLPESNRRWLLSALAEESKRVVSDRRRTNFLASLAHWPIWVLVLVYFARSVGASLIFWFPQYAKSLFPTASTVQIGWLTIAPYVIGLLTIFAVGWSSDRSGDRKWHLAATAIVPALMLVVATQIGEPVPAFVLMCIAFGLSYGYYPVFYAVPGTVLAGTAMAGGVGLITGLGQLGSTLGPSVVGTLKTATGSFGPGFVVSACVFAAAGVLPLIFTTLFAPVSRSNAEGSE